MGTYTRPDGRSYEGMWDQGKQHGAGRWTKDGKTWKSGRWRKGKLVSSEPSTGKDKENIAPNKKHGGALKKARQ